eukprot:933306-Rhodomonas_salina.1
MPQQKQHRRQRRGSHVHEPLPLRSFSSHSPRYVPASPLSVRRPIPERLSSLKHPTYTSPFL